MYQKKKKKKFHLAIDMKINEIINQVLVENNQHINKEQVEHSISEGRMVITRDDVHEIIKRLPIQIYGSNIHAEITDEGIIIKQNT